VNRKRRTIIGDAWTDYCHRVVPHSAGREQVLQTRQAFYAGALAVVSGMEAAISPDGSEPTAEDYCVGEDVAAELDAFARECAIEEKRHARARGRPPA
jgi:hypothetical protein